MNWCVGGVPAHSYIAWEDMDTWLHETLDQCGHESPSWVLLGWFLSIPTSSRSTWVVTWSMVIGHASSHISYRSAPRQVYRGPRSNTHPNMPTVLQTSHSFICKDTLSSLWNSSKNFFLKLSECMTQNLLLLGNYGRRSPPELYEGSIQVLDVKVVHQKSTKPDIVWRAYGESEWFS